MLVIINDSKSVSAVGSLCLPGDGRNLPSRLAAASGRIYMPGDTLDLPDAEAARLIELGVVVVPPVTETD